MATATREITSLIVGRAITGIDAFVRPGGSGAWTG
jgi:hypothetical protein